MTQRPIQDVLIEATRRAHELSLLLTEAEAIGKPIDVEVTRLNVAGRTPIVSVLVLPTKL